MRFFRSFVLPVGAALAAGSTILTGPASRADTIRNPSAVFAGLDKITGRIITFDVAIDETVQFGTLQITPRVCLTRPQTEAPLTEGFVEVDEIATAHDGAKTAKRNFSGWMFAASPGLHGVEHPVYDVWLKTCKGGVEVTPSPVNAQPDAGKAPPANASAPPAPGAPAAKPRRTIQPQEPVEPSMESLPPSDVDAPPPSGPDMPDRAPSPGDNGLGAPIEVGPGPGAAPRGRANGVQAPPPDQNGPIDIGPAPGDQPQAAPNAAGPGGAPNGVPKPPKPKRKPPVDPNAPVPPADIPQPAPQSAPQPQRQQQPSGPQDLIKNLPFFR
jgi:hypothetical protein